MDSEKCLNDPEGQSVRKDWIMSLYLVIFMLVINAGVIGIATSEFDTMFFSIVQSLLKLWALYYCAYKKHGRKYLGFFIIINGVFYLIQSIAGFRDSMDFICSGVGALSAFLLLFTVIDIIINGYFILNCCRLFQLNSTMNNRLKEAQRQHLTVS